MYIGRRIWRRRRKTGEVNVATNYWLNYSLFLRDGQGDAWIGTALFAVGLYWNRWDRHAGKRMTGFMFCFWPRLNRKEAENLYALNVDARVPVSGTCEPIAIRF